MGGMEMKGAVYRNILEEKQIKASFHFREIFYKWMTKFYNP
jgi:hypothetical protein